MNFSATYKSPTSESFTITNAIPAPATSAAQDKSQYLSSLRAAVAAAQDRINKELTARMEEDKAQEAAKGVRAAAADEDKEEENYGEEVQEEED